MDGFNDHPEYDKEWNRVKAELELEDQIAMVSEQLEMQELMQEAYEKDEAYGKGYAEGFIAGARFFYDKEAAKWLSRAQKYDDLSKRWRSLD